MPLSRVADPGGFYPDPTSEKKITGFGSDLREKKTDPEPTSEKKTWIRNQPLKKPDADLT